MKRILAIALVLCMIFSISITAYGLEDPVYTKRKSMKAERMLWSELSLYSPSDVITAGVLSYFWRESQYRSDAVAGCYSSLAGYGIDLCQEMLDKIDPGLDDGSTRNKFIKLVRRYGGYGLGQWRSRAYLEDLYDLAYERQMSIGDARLQCEFIFVSLEKNEELWSKLNRCTDPERAGRLISIYYDGSQSAAPYIGWKAKKLFEKYTEED